MAFLCPRCGEATLRILHRLDLPSDDRSDEIAVQVIACDGCSFQGAAVYEESRRGPLDCEAWEHVGYRLEPGRWEELAASMASCPNPGDTGCRCLCHLWLGRTKDGRWCGLPHVAGSFSMDLV